MSKRERRNSAESGRKVRVDFRPNRDPGGRKRAWTRQWRQDEFIEVDTDLVESVRKTAHTRKRTVIEQDDGQVGRVCDTTREGVVLAMRGLTADVSDGREVWPCSVRRVLRTRRIEERQAVAVGDRVRFACVADREGVEREGVIEAVAPRRSVLQRIVGNKVHTIAANVDLAWIVSAADDPPPKPHLIDRCLVAALAGDLTPIVVINKADLDAARLGGRIVRRYAALGYRSILISAHTGQGLDAVRQLLKDKSSVFVGQSGVGKSAILNAIQPSLQLRTGEISETVHKGRHTTTTARLLTLDIGGYVVDTPGVRTLELPPLELGEIEGYFVEFVDRVKDCKYPDCAHVEEQGCAIRAAVQAGEIHPDRYDSYLRMLAEG